MTSSIGFHINLYKDGFVQERPENDKDKTLEVLLKKARKGSVEALYNLGVLYTQKNTDTAIRWFERAAEHGHGRAQSVLIDWYIKDLRFIEMRPRAAYWCKKLAKQGDAAAQYKLGLLYGGYGVKKKDLKAAKWFKKSAEQGNAHAQFILGSHYHFAKAGFEKNNIESIRWWNKAAEQGNAYAQSNLGYMHALGFGVEKSDVEAAKWFQKAANQGIGAAQHALGIMYEEGLGLVKNELEAARLKQLALNQGYSPPDPVRMNGEWRYVIYGYVIYNFFKEPSVQFG